MRRTSADDAIASARRRRGRPLRAGLDRCRQSIAGKGGGPASSRRSYRSMSNVIVQLEHILKRLKYTTGHGETARTAGNCEGRRRDRLRPDKFRWLHRGEHLNARRLPRGHLTGKLRDHPERIRAVSSIDSVDPKLQGDLAVIPAGRRGVQIDTSGVFGSASDPGRRHPPRCRLEDSTGLRGSCPSATA